MRVQVGCPDRASRLDQKPRGFRMVGFHGHPVAHLADDGEDLAPDLPAILVWTERLADLCPRKAGADGVDEGAVLHGGIPLAARGWVMYASHP